jgi:hypothetical protein
MTGKFTGNPYICWYKPWFPVDFPLNQSIEINVVSVSFARPNPDVASMDPRKA